MNTHSGATSERDLPTRLLLVWDIIIIVLVSANLTLIIFDSLFRFNVFAGTIRAVAPGFYALYASHVHAHFGDIDLAFVAIFFADVLLGWSIAIVQRRFHRWFFYPFVHWYDVLGCIPIAGFRLLRVLRVFTIGFRLQKLGIIDVRNWTVYETFEKYYSILVEEVSDHVVVNVLSGVQAEINSGGQAMSQRVVQEVIQPRKDQLISTISSRVETTLREVHDVSRAEIRDYIGAVVGQTINNSSLTHNVHKVPMLGALMAKTVDEAVTDIVCTVLQDAVESLGSREYEALVRRIVDHLFATVLDADTVDASELSQVIVQILDLVKERVLVQRWKERYA